MRSSKPKNDLSGKLLALGLGLLLLLLTEGLLSLIGVPPLANDNRLVGFADRPLFVAETVGQVSRYRRDPVREKFFNPQSFIMPKPVETFRIVSFGGSTTYGRPWFYETAFPAWLGKLLQQYAPGRNYESLNLGGISYASYRVERLVEEMTAYAPDLFILYSGHNEFLEARTFENIQAQPVAIRTLRSWLHRVRIYSLLSRAIDRLSGRFAAVEPLAEIGGLQVRLEQIGGTDLYQRDPEFHAKVVQQYRASILKMVQHCKERNIPLILATLPANLAGVTPFKSAHRQGLSAAEAVAWQEAFATGLTELTAGNWRQALERFSAAQQIDPLYAELHFRKGQAYAALGETEAAYAAFTRARQEDIIPLRALDEFNQILREVAREQQLPLADVEASFRRLATDGIPGNDWFVDHVHPTIEGQQLIAWVLLDTASKAGLVPLSTAQWRRSIGEARQFLRQAAAEISPRYRALGLWGVGRLFFWAGKYPEAHQALRQAWQSIEDEPEIPTLLGRLENALGNGDQALQYLFAARRLAADDPEVRVALANAYSLLGRGSQALAELDRPPTADPNSAGVQRARGRALLALEQNRAAVAAFRRAVELAPAQADIWRELAETLQQSGQPAAAESAYRDYLTKTGAVAIEQRLQQWQTGFPAAAGEAGR